MKHDNCKCPLCEGGALNDANQKPKDEQNDTQAKWDYYEELEKSQENGMTNFVKTRILH